MILAEDERERVEQEEILKEALIAHGIRIVIDWTLPIEQLREIYPAAAELACFSTPWPKRRKVGSQYMAQGAILPEEDR